MVRGGLYTDRVSKRWMGEQVRGVCRYARGSNSARDDHWPRLSTSKKCNSKEVERQDVRKIGSQTVSPFHFKAEIQYVLARGADSTYRGRNTTLE